MRFALIAGLAGIGLGFFAGSREPAVTAHQRAALPGTAVQAGDFPDTPAARPLARALPEPAVSLSHEKADPVPTLARLRAEKDPNRRRRAVDELCAGLEAPELRALLTALGRQFSMALFERDLGEKLLARWAEIDPRAAADYAVETNGSTDWSSIYGVLQVWAGSDLAAAKVWALASRDRVGHQSGVNAIISVLAETDPQAALAFLDELPPAKRKSLYISTLFPSFAQKDPTHAAELALQLTSRALRQQAAREVMAVWGVKEPGRALGWFFQSVPSEIDEWQTRQTTQEILRNWVSTAPEEAVAFATAQPPGAARNTLISSLGESWGAVDPEAAASWLRGLPKSQESYRAFDSLIGSWTKTDPARAGSFLLSQPAERTRDWLLDTLGRNWASEDPAAALAWARQQSAPEVERLVAAEALGAMAAKDLPNAERYLSQSRTPEARSEAIVTTANALTQRDPKRAADWVMQMAKTEAVGRAIEWPVQSWTWRDPDAVAGWLNEQATNPQRDAAVGAFANALSRKDAAAAAAWAGSIGDETLRRKRVKEVVDIWAGKDSGAARAWVEAQGFPPAEQQELRQTLERAGLR